MTSLVEESNVKKPESSAMEEKEVEIEETSQDLSENPSEKETDLEKVKADFEETEVKDSTDREVKSQTDKKENTSGGRVIVITSGKGGVGKTTTNANIGTALARAGKKVVMIDTDLGLRNLDLLLGLENRIVYTIVDVVEERCKLRQALVKDKKNPNLCLLAAAQTRDKSAVTEDQLREICEELKQTFDFILVDCPAGIEQGFQNAVAGASEAIVVTTPEMSAVRDADRIIGLLEAREEIKTYKVLVNRVRPNLIKEKNMMSVEDVLELLSANLIGVIPEDTGIITSTNKGEPIVNDEKSLAGQAYRNVAKRIIGENVPFLNLEEDTGFGAKVKKFFNKLMGKENN